MNRSEHAGPEIANPFLHQQSDSLITGLCREMEGLRSRCGQLIEELARSREGCLADRLRRELSSPASAPAGPAAKREGTAPGAAEGFPLVWNSWMN